MLDDNGVAVPTTMTCSTPTSRETFDFSTHNMRESFINRQIFNEPNMLDMHFNQEPSRNSPVRQPLMPQAIAQLSHPDASAGRPKTVAEHSAEMQHSTDRFQRAGNQSHPTQLQNIERIEILQLRETITLSETTGDTLPLSPFLHDLMEFSRMTSHKSPWNNQVHQIQLAGQLHNLR